MTAFSRSGIAAWLWLACVACGASTPKAAAPSKSAVASGSEVPCAGAARKEQTLLREYLPDSANASFILRRNALSMLEDFLADNPEMTRELSQHFKRTLGVDLSSVRGIAGFAIWPSEDSKAAAFLHLGQPSPLSGKPIETHRGVGIFASGIDPALVMASVKDGVWLGTPAGVKYALDHTLTASRAAVSPWPSDHLDVDVVAHGALWMVADEEIQQIVTRFGLRDFILTLDRDNVLTLRVRGSDERIEQAKSLIDNAIDVAMAAASIGLQQSLGEGEVWSGAASIVARHQLDKLVNELRPVVEGNDLISRYRFGESGQMVVAGLGISAAIAVPAFATYVRRSKASEATVHLKQIALLIAERDAMLRESAPKPKLKTKKKPKPIAPFSIARTPATVPCGDDIEWSDAERAAFATLGFSPEAPTYYSYEVAPASELADSKVVGAELIVRATGDLDCDGVLSTFDLGLRRVEGGALVVDDVPVVQNETE